MGIVEEGEDGSFCEASHKASKFILGEGVKIPTIINNKSCCLAGILNNFGVYMMIKKNESLPSSLSISSVASPLKLGDSMVWVSNKSFAESISCLQNRGSRASLMAKIQYKNGGANGGMVEEEQWLKKHGGVENDETKLRFTTHALATLDSESNKRLLNFTVVAF
ncbi:hypothetical protein K1719_012059 [Acacia pycnantha]|nr:hypothetical protein K1719_012059 [Acacia pycnantha]